MPAVVIIQNKEAANLATKLAALAPDCKVLAHLHTVAQCLHYFSGAAPVDIIFSDVRLSDGAAFDAFEKCALKTPVIYMAADVALLHPALQCNGIAYLIKPYSDAHLLQALNAYHKLRQHFSKAHAGNNAQRERCRKRITVKQGKEWFFLLLEDVVLFYAQQKTTFALDKHGNGFATDKNLSSLEAALDHQTFFRANRQYIVNINFVKGYCMQHHSRLLLRLHGAPQHEVIISQELTPQFKEWICHAAI